MLLQDSAISAALAAAAVGTPADATEAVMTAAAAEMVGANASTALIGADHCDAVTTVIAASDVSLTATEQSPVRQRHWGCAGRPVSVRGFAEAAKPADSCLRQRSATQHWQHGRRTR